MKKSLFNFFDITYILITIIIAGFILVGLMISRDERDLVNSLELRHKSYLLADELRQTSDDLTRLARSYVITKDDKFRVYYNKILDIRDGLSPRPEKYDLIYWDLVISGELGEIDGEKIALIELMKLNEFPDDEIALLSKSKSNSDDLVVTERIAMNAVNNIADNEVKNLMIPGETLEELSIRILFDENYHKSKSEIMKPIDNFFSKLEERTTKSVDASLKKLFDLLLIIGIIVLIVIIALIIIFSNANEVIKKSKDELKEQVKIRTKKLEVIIKELEVTQNKMIESEKMASLGGLVAGVAHEVSTPIGIGVTLSSNLESKMALFKEKYESGNVTRKDFEKHIQLVEESARIISNNMKRAADLIDNFKLVSVDQSSEDHRLFNVKEYINIIYNNLKVRYKGYNIKVNIICPDDLTIKSYPGAISQIINNLVINTFTHGFNRGDIGNIVIEVQSYGGYIKILYSDTGKGISDDHIQKIFEPFFTTNRGSGGSGLGLHIVYNIVTQTLKGTINAYSELGIGTEFEISFPNIK